MEKTTFIFIPNNFNYDQKGKIEGFYCEKDNSDVYYISNKQQSGITKVLNTNVTGKQENTSDSAYNIINNHLSINSKTKNIIVNNTKDTSTITKVIYDYDKFFNSYVVHSKIVNYGEHFEELTKYLRERCTPKLASTETPSILFKCMLAICGLLVSVAKKTEENFGSMLTYSATMTEIIEGFCSILYILQSLSKRKYNPKVLNLCVAKIMDVIIGIIFIKYIILYKEELLFIVEEAAKVILQRLIDLLQYLKGSPIGLKLNDAFNNTLASFFFYHITLWRLFLKEMHPYLVQYFGIFLIPGFGISLQIAIISDMFSFATCHVYCIYVYAAKLFQIQVKGIISLWRLFIGKKYNPLRTRVDSWEYNQHQLFIGTLGFTILLFLLPTTTMYYVVFTVLRLILLGIVETLYRIRRIIKNLPLYIMLLWVFNSSSIAGSLRITLEDDVNFKGVTIKANLDPLPLWSAIKMLGKNEIETKKTSVGCSIRNIITGILI